MDFTIPILILLGIFTIFFMLAVYASRVQKVGPNQVLVISGRGEGRRDVGEIRSNFRIVTGGRSFVWPIFERVDDLSLEIMTIDIVTPDVPTVEGVPVTVDGVAQVKIGSDENSIRTAAIQFLSKTQDEIRHVAHETLAGHLRAILGTLTVEQLYRDREAFAQKVQEVSGDDMASMGMEIVSFVIKDISDAEGYLEALGRPRIAQVKRDADIGEAEASRDATIRSAEARQEGESAKFRAETKIAESEKDYQVEKAAYEAEVNRRRAEAELAYTLQQNIENQKVKSEEVQIEVIERQKRIEVQEQEVQRKEKELEAEVRKPAEAEQYRVQKLADARKYQIQTEASGEAEAIRQRGEGEASAEKARGLAKADVTRQQGLAEAEATLKKSDAWRTYTQAAIIQQVIDALPQIASAVASPLAKTDRIVVINNGSDGQGTGSSKVTQDVTDIMSQLPATIEALTGVDLMEILKDLPSVQQAAGQQSANPEAPAADGESDGSQQA
ncbi:MAG: SPFH domain-containing protein [Candidatus Promineifilaceae bacterium]|nr:SPFH domain-containing protein [Candidatus Promineifilaceae bacterium]